MIFEDMLMRFLNIDYLMVEKIDCTRSLGVSEKLHIASVEDETFG